MDYDSARHHYESLQTAKKKDEAKIAKVRSPVGGGHDMSLLILMSDLLDLFKIGFSLTAELFSI